MARAGMPTLLLLLLAAGPGSASAGLQQGCRGGCAEEGGAGSPADDGCAEGGGCLRREGQPCGVYVSECAPGLQCRPRENEEAPLRALLAGQGRCQRARGPAEESKPHAGASRPRETSHRDRQKNPGTSSTPIRPNPGGTQDSEMGPCRRHLDSVLQQLQTEVFRGGRGLYVPNCDLRGFYRKQQCRSSQGVAVVPAGVWIPWASPCQCLQAAPEALTALPGAVADRRELPGPWQEGAVL